MHIATSISGGGIKTVLRLFIYIKTTYRDAAKVTTSRNIRLDQKYQDLNFYYQIASVFLTSLFYTVSQKKQATTLCPHFRQILTDFQNSVAHSR